MSAPTDKDERRVPPDGSKWLEAQRSMTERNEQAKKAARQERDEYERALAGRRAKRERGKVDR
jgi:hypothetical protein